MSTSLTIHSVERITLEDHASERYRWVRIYFHRKDEETLEIVAFPADGGTLRVGQPEPDFADMPLDELDEVKP